MQRRSWTTAVALLGGVVVLAGMLSPSAAKAPGADEKPKQAKDIFGLNKVISVHLEVPAKEWERMQPAGGGRGPGGFGPGGFGPGPKRDPMPDSHRGSGFGTEFPFGRASVTVGDKAFDNVGLRYKGNFSYMASTRGLKRNFKINLDHYEEDQRFLNLKTINLNAGTVDTSKAREALAFSIFRAAGVPAPRTAFAEVTLTVPGKYDKEYLGLYTFIEQVDKAFLKAHFKNNKGLLMKPERTRAFEYLGDDWARYKNQYQPKHEPTKKETERVIAFAKLIHRADDEQFRKEVHSYLDVDEFLRFLAVNSMVANMDSMFTMGHNYYIYLHPETDKFILIPWDLDLSFAGMMMNGSPEQQTDLSLTHPYAGEHKLVDRLLAMKDVNEKYQKLLKEVAKVAFTKEKVLKDLDTIEKTTKEILVREKKAAEARKEGGNNPMMGMVGRVDLRTFVAKRADSIVAQIEGKSKGYVPTMGFGPGGQPGGFGVGNFLAKPVLAALDTNKDGKVSKEELLAGVKKFFKDTDKDNKGKLDEKTLADGLNRLSAQQPGRGGPGGFAPGPQLAASVLKRADADKDGKVTLDELLAAAGALFKEFDKDKNGFLDEKEMTEAINALFPMPQGPGRQGQFALGNILAKPVLEALDTNKDSRVTKDEMIAGLKTFFKESDKDNKGKLDEKALANGLNRIWPLPPGFARPAPGAFGPGSMVAGNLFRRADADKDGKVTLDELLAAAEALFKEFDKDKKGSLGEKELVEAINSLFPMPQGPGRPGPRPEEPKKEEKKEEKKP